MPEVDDREEYRWNFEDGFFAALAGLESHEGCTNPAAWTAGFEHGQRLSGVVDEADARA